MESFSTLIGPAGWICKAASKVQAMLLKRRHHLTLMIGQREQCYELVSESLFNDLDDKPLRNKKNELHFSKLTDMAATGLPEKLPNVKHLEANIFFTKDTIHESEATLSALSELIRAYGDSLLALTIRVSDDMPFAKFDSACTKKKKIKKEAMWKIFRTIIRYCTHEPTKECPKPPGLRSFTLEMPTDVLFVDQKGNQSSIHPPSRYLLPLFRSLQHFRYSTRDTYFLLEDLLPKLPINERLETIALDFPNIPLYFKSEIEKVFDRYLAGTLQIMPFNIPIQICNKVIHFGFGIDVITYEAEKLVAKQSFTSLSHLEFDRSFNYEHLSSILTHYRSVTRLTINMKHYDHKWIHRNNYGKPLNRSIRRLDLTWRHKNFPNMFERFSEIEPLLHYLPCLELISFWQIGESKHDEAPNKTVTKHIEKVRTFLKPCRRFCPNLASLDVFIMMFRDEDAKDILYRCEEMFSLLD